MNINIFLASLGLIGLLIYSFSQWAIKGDFFHPGFIYSVVNSFIFIIFAFGPYIYGKYEIPSFYYYIYVGLLCIFVVGIVWGSAKGQRKLVKDIKLTTGQLNLLYWLSVLNAIAIVAPLILSSGGSIEGSVTNRFDNLEFMGDTSNSNPFRFFISNFQLSFSLVSTAVITSYSLWQRRNYSRIAVLLSLIIINALFANSRTNFVLNFSTILVPILYIGITRGTANFNQIKWSKYIKYILPALALTLVMIVVLTNVRGSVTTEGTDFQVPYEALETLLEVKRKPWFENLTNDLPTSLMTPISTLSLYAGGTVACGGAVTHIAPTYGLMTWGARSLVPVHRILERSGFATGFVNWASQNLENIWVMGSPECRYWWWGDPANFIADFGLLGAPLASLTIGWMVGWIYGRIYQSGPIIKSTGTAIILMSMIMTPAAGPFSFFHSFLNFLFVGYLCLKNSYKNKVIIRNGKAITPSNLTVK